MTPRDPSRTVVLAAVDDSALNERVVEVAATLARAPGAELHLAHIVDTLPVASVSVGGSAIGLPGPRELLRAGHEVLSRLVHFAREHGARPTGHLRLGIAWRSVVQLATDIDADVLVVGTHDPGGLERLLLGSVTEILVRKSPCSVVVVRPKRAVAKAIPEIDPACADCLKAQRESSGAILWCARHAEHHRAAHTYSDIPDSFAMGSLTIRPDLLAGSSNTRPCPVRRRGKPQRMRERSFWAWGYEDRFPDTTARRALGEQVGALLGTDALEPGEPKTLAEIDLPVSRLAPPEDLAAIATTDRRERALHTYGRAYRDLVRGFRGDFRAAPDLVMFPEREEDVVRSLAWASRERVAVIPFGGGTSVVGGVEAVGLEAFRGVVSLDLRAMDRVLDVDPVSRTARIQAGALGPSLEAQLAEHGLTLRHFPQSFEHSTLGGWVATRAGGHFATLATHIDDLVASVRMVTPAGVLATPRLPASGAGPSPDRLVLGSEGILGVITEACVRVRPRPRFRASATVLFPDLSAAARAVRAIVQAGLYPSNCRVLDPHEAKLAFVPAEGGAALLLAFESEDHPLGPWMDRGVALAEAHGGRLARPPQLKESGERGGDSAAEAWRRAFFEGPYLQSALVTLGVVADTFETACPWDRFEGLHAAVTEAVHEAIRAVSGRGGLVSCRFTHAYTDGVAPYYTFVAPPPKGDVLAAWAVIKTAASDAILASGGTITHHHAVGRTHRPWYDRERPEPFAMALRAAKHALDPAGVLNPGVLIDA